ncbi:hypothetical protein LIER_12735 [Lithospermum erythrorhizon]|uniref:Uncharacterized protein n=1 Tax=Lithospermum erythrorhizon TaxID=34254 RepID=A0AAV3PT27_LITER
MPPLLSSSHLHHRFPLLSLRSNQGKVHSFVRSGLIPSLAEAQMYYQLVAENRSVPPLYGEGAYFSKTAEPLENS